MGTRNIRGITLDASHAQAYAAALQRAPEAARAELGTGLEEAGLYYMREVKEATPVGHTQLLRASIAIERRDVPFDPRVRVFSPLAYAAPVELGSRPHWAPLEPLQDWVRGKLGITEDAEVERVARAIQRKIAARGTRARQMFGLTIDTVEPQLREILRRAVQRFLDRVRRG